MTEDQRFGRELEDDHDLLTFNESAARLREEIAKAEAELVELAQRPESEARSAALARAQRRLEQLVASQDRNSVETAQHGDGRGFLDYRPPQPR